MNFQLSIWPSAVSTIAASCNSGRDAQLPDGTRLRLQLTFKRKDYGLKNRVGFGILVTVFFLVTMLGMFGTIETAKENLRSKISKLHEQTEAAPIPNNPPPDSSVAPAASTISADPLKEALERYKAAKVAVLGKMEKRRISVDMRSYFEVALSSLENGNYQSADYIISSNAFLSSLMADDYNQLEDLWKNFMKLREKALSEGREIPHL